VKMWKCTIWMWMFLNDLRLSFLSPRLNIRSLSHIICRYINIVRKKSICLSQDANHNNKSPSQQQSSQSALSDPDNPQNAFNLLWKWKGRPWAVRDISPPRHFFWLQLFFQRPMNSTWYRRLRLYWMKRKVGSRNCCSKEVYPESGYIS
jgi:hypothetical protein